MGKVKHGQRVTHGKSGRTGVVTAIVRGVAHVAFDDGAKRQVRTSSLHKPSGCPLAILALIVGMGVMGWLGYQAAGWLS